MRNHLEGLAAQGWLTVVLSVAPCGLLEAQQSQVVMRQVAASQALTEIALRMTAQPSGVNPAAIELERVSGIAGELELWRATLPSDHSHPYLLAVLDGEVIRLGGFSAPELGAVAPRLIRGEIDAKSARALAEQLALLADPNGAIQWVLGERAEQVGHISSVTSAWKKHAPTDWPRDTVVATDAGWFVNLTLLSRDTRSYTLHWVPLAISLEFDRDGRLLAWAWRSGELFGVPGIPVAPSGTPKPR